MKVGPLRGTVPLQTYRAGADPGSGPLEVKDGLLGACSAGTILVVSLSRTMFLAVRSPGAALCMR